VRAEQAGGEVDPHGVHLARMSAEALGEPHRMADVQRSCDPATVDCVRQATDDAVEHDQHRNLEQQRQEATQRVHAVFPVERYGGLVETDPIALVLLLELLELRLQALHGQR